jgi:hypothetical protein
MSFLPQWLQAELSAPNPATTPSARIERDQKLQALFAEEVDNLLAETVPVRMAQHQAVGFGHARLIKK